MCSSKQELNMVDRTEAPRDQWELEYCFTDESGERITCDRDTCELGSYIVGRTISSVSYSPACTTCEFSGGLDAVFNEAEPKFKEGAPEDFKVGAARALTRDPGSPLETAIRIGRPDTAAMIDQYAADPESV